MQSNSTMQLRASCDIITSHLDGRKITHSWIDEYKLSDSPTDAVMAFSKKKNKYIAMVHLRQHLQTIDLKNYAFFVPAVIHDSRWLISQRDIEWLVKDLNKQHARMCDKLYVKVECIESYVEGMSPKFRYFITIPSHHMSVSLPGFKRFSQYNKKRKKHSS